MYLYTPRYTQHLDQLNLFLLISVLGCEVVEGDYDEYDSLRPCLEGAWGCFAVTDYFETMDKSCEVQEVSFKINISVLYSGR